MTMCTRKTFSFMIILAMLFTLLLPAVVNADATSLPALYYGTLKAKSSTGTLTDMPAGQTITAYYVDSSNQKIEVGRLVTTEAGKYGGPNGLDIRLAINENGKLNGGETVTIAVNGIDVTTVRYYASTLNELNLEVASSGTPSTSTSIPNWGPTSNTLTDKKPVIWADLSATGSEIDTATIKMKLNGNDITPTSKTATKVSYTPAAELEIKQHTVYVEVSNRAGVKATRTWTFTIVTSGGGNTDPNPPPSGGGTPSTGGGSTAPSYMESIKKLDGTTLFTRPVTLDGTTAKGVLSSDDVKSALNQVTADAKGVKTVVIEMPEIQSATAFLQDFPVEALSGAAKVKFVLKAGITTLDLPGTMFAAPGTAKTISLTIAKADTTGVAAADAALIGTRPVIKLSAALDGKATAWSNRDAAVQVTVKYTPTADELKAPQFIVVKGIDDNGKLYYVPTGRFVTDKDMVSFKTAAFGKFAVAYAKRSFSDLTKAPWARNFVETLASKGVINGTGADSYSPQAMMKRADYVVLLVNTLGLNAKFTDNYSDVKQNNYFYNALGIAKQLGITGEQPDNKFNPMAGITREDMMVFTARALNLVDKLELDGTADDIKSFTDAADIAPDAVELVASLVKHGVIGGSNNKLNPKANATRAELAAVLFKVYNR